MLDRWCRCCRRRFETSSRSSRGNGVVPRAAAAAAAAVDATPGGAGDPRPRRPASATTSAGRPAHHLRWARTTGRARASGRALTMKREFARGRGALAGIGVPTAGSRCLPGVRQWSGGFTLTSHPLALTLTHRPRRGTIRTGGRLLKPRQLGMGRFIRDWCTGGMAMLAREEALSGKETIALNGTSAAVGRSRATATGSTVCRTRKAGRARHLVVRIVVWRAAAAVGIVRRWARVAITAGMPTLRLPLPALTLERQQP